MMVMGNRNSTSGDVAVAVAVDGDGDGDVATCFSLVAVWSMEKRRDETRVLSAEHRIQSTE